MRCRRGLPAAGRQHRSVRVQDDLDGPVSLGVDADLEAAGVEIADHRGQLVALEVQDARTVRRHRVGPVDRRGAAAHPAVGPDLHGLGGQLAGMTALQAGLEEPVHLVVHDQTVDPLAEQAARVRLGERGEGVAPHVGIAGRRQAERGQALARRLYQLGPGGARLGEVTPDVLLEQREHRCLVHHAVEPALAVAAERAARWIGLVLGESRLPQRGRVQHADVQRRVVQHGRAVRHGRVELRPVRMPALAELVLGVPGPGDPGAARSPFGGLPEPCLNRGDVGRRRLAAVGGGREVADVSHVAVRVDQARDDGRPAEPHHVGAGRGRADRLGLPHGSDPAIPDQHTVGGPGAGCHRDDIGISNDQLHHASRSERTSARNPDTGAPAVSRSSG